MQKKYIAKKIMLLKTLLKIILIKLNMIKYLLFKKKEILILFSDILKTLFLIKIIFY